VGKDAFLTQGAVQRKSSIPLVNQEQTEEECEGEDGHLAG